MATKRTNVKNYQQLLDQLGQNIQRHMHKQGLTWREVGEHLDTSTNTVGRWIHAECSCGLKNLLKLGRLFKCRLRDLLPDIQ